MSQPCELEVDHDLIVIGSGIVASALIDQYRTVHPNHKILCIERGPADNNDHISRLQQLSTEGDIVPVDAAWVLSPQTAQSSELNTCAGSAFVLGGRSHYWYGWCVQPEVDCVRAEMLGSMSDSIFWRSARDFLGVNEVTKLGICSSALQSRLQERLSDAKIAHRVAEFAVAEPSSTEWTRPDLLRTMRDAVEDGSLTILTDRAVTKLERSFDAVDRIATSKGMLRLTNKKVNVVICAGAVPTTGIVMATLELSSDLRLPCHGHVRTHIFAKIKGSVFDRVEPLHSGLAAVVIPSDGTTSSGQFHIQMSAFRLSRPCSDAGKSSPRYGTTVGPAQSRGLGDDVLISCAGLGEFSSSGSYLSRLDQADDLMMRLHLKMSDGDRSLWDSMDDAMLKAIQALTKDHASISYWHNDRGWQAEEPLIGQRRSPVLVHEGGFTPIDDAAGLITSDFRVRDCSNAYALSGAMLNSGSFNPTLTLCALARELARNIT